MADQSETQRQIEEKRRQDTAALERTLREQQAERERRDAEEWRN